MRTELERRRANVRKVRAFLEAHPGEWINARAFEVVAGRQGWRTRISELRQVLKTDGLGTIENRQSRKTGVVISEYRYLPFEPLARDASVYRPQDLFDNQDRPFAR